MSNESILHEIYTERRKQDEQWGGAHHDDQHGWYDWIRLMEMQAFKMSDGCADMRERFVKMAALAVAAVESIDRQEKK